MANRYGGQRQQQRKSAPFASPIETLVRRILPLPPRRASLHVTVVGGEGASIQERARQARREHTIRRCAHPGRTSSPRKVAKGRRKTWPRTPHPRAIFSRAGGAIIASDEADGRPAAGAVHLR